MTRSFATSTDGQWAVYRDDHELLTFEGGRAPAVGTLPLLDGAADHVDVALVGPPTAIAIVTRGRSSATVALHQPPYLDAVAQLELDAPMHLAAVTGPRLALVSTDRKRVEIVRAAGHALASTALEVGSPVEFVVGLERNQLLFGLMRKLEVWDAVSARPLLRLQLQLPPPPRTVGAAAGHLWVTRPGSDEVFIYRMSDGRPFRHYVGAPVDAVICHPASPLLVLITPRGLVRLHCFAHSLLVLDVPPHFGIETAALAQLVAGDDISLIGIPAGAREPWHAAISGTGAPATPVETDDDELADKPRARTPSDTGARAIAAAPRTRATTASGATGNARWREPLVAYAQELVRGVDAELPVIAIDTELGALAQRLGLATTARRALLVLYALHLVGEPALSIARLSRALGGDWSEPLGTGELGQLAMLRRAGGKLSLRAPVTELLDGQPPRVRVVEGDASGSSAPPASRVARAGRSDAALDAALAAQLGRIAVIDGAIGSRLLDARLLGATAIALVAPAARPAVWPRDTALVIVTDAGDPPPAWVATLPALPNA